MFLILFHLTDIDQRHIDQERRCTERIVVVDLRGIVIRGAEYEIEDKERDQKDHAVRLLRKERHEEQREHHLQKHHEGFLAVDKDRQRVARITEDVAENGEHSLVLRSH